MDVTHARGNAVWKSALLAAVLLHASLTAGCKSHTISTETAPGFRVALLTPGPVSDAGWNAAAYQGLELIKRKLGAQTALVQTTSPTDFEEIGRASCRERV